MPALVLLHMLLDLPSQNRITLLNRTRSLDDEGLRHLAFAVRGHADDDAVVDCWVREQVRFEFCGRNLQTLDFDESEYNVLVGAAMAWLGVEG